MPTSPREGHISNPAHRKRAIRVWKSGGCVYIVTGNDSYGVGGIFFNLDDSRAVDKVILTKSSTQKTRQALFGIMTPNEDFQRVVDINYQLNLSHKLPIFIRAPAKLPHNFPAWAVSVDLDRPPVIQCFLSDHVKHFGTLIREAAKVGIRVGGTSLNLSGQGNVDNLNTALSFFRTKSTPPDFWLHTSHPLTGVSHTIIELEQAAPKAKLHRAGGIDFEQVKSQLDLT